MRSRRQYKKQMQREWKRLHGIEPWSKEYVTAAAHFWAEVRPLLLRDRVRCEAFARDALSIGLLTVRAGTFGLRMWSLFVRKAWETLWQQRNATKARKE